ncbi:hypothetical protein FSP39_000378 [Pinctada imbricata]|uniref:XK-related protein n=1 Tax=Pinctada imbricata TaxID=66713 RepID=A0AA88XXQ3_PINIB|nr:hypothetical protein FSP39_000378 [Pinctada imbricata]
MTEYYVDGEMTSFALTLTFIVVPAIITSIISILWYHQTYKRNIEEYETKIGDSPVRAKWKEKQRRHSHKLFVVRFIFSLLQLGRIFRYVVL